MAGLGLELYLSSDAEDGLHTEDPPSAERFVEGPTATADPSATGDPADAALLDLPTHMTFPLPPVNRRYNTAEEGIDAINQFAFDHGYAVVKRRSKKTKGQVPRIKKVQLQYDRGGVYTPQSEVPSEVPGETLVSPSEPSETTEPPTGEATITSKKPRKRKTTTLALDCLFDISLRL
ncbi:uncharacterized protein N7473_000210 [Penicillium subrubescens]|uniref:uncharacterized protein n=1 Tax=Penicillium subrubescens TaxID=1316194 RepID=UPI002545935F|nr:uncharacterized protein N7473_000210 [Penicillium subrubescens]KAJ5910907.1 hypothetical protein N7473_000210 [Penicillium subrubescens]